MSRTLSLVLGAAFWLLTASVAWSQQPVPLPDPTGRVILEVGGDIAVGNARSADGGLLARFDLAMLDALGESSIRTATPWDDTRTYAGPLGHVVLNRLGASGETIIAEALNEYSARIPLSDFMTRGIILATRVDGEIISIREKGPIFVMYPFDEHPELKRAEFFERSVWQLSRLRVE